MKGFLRAKRDLIVSAYDRVMLMVDTRLRIWAAVLNRKSAGFSHRQLTVGLVGFCIVFGSVVTLTIWQSIDGLGRHRSSSPVSVPKHVIQKDSMALERRKLELVSRARIRHRLDSIKHADNGPKLLEDLRISRPGLLDSLKVFEKIE